MTDFTLTDVLTWARTKPADQRYCYNSNGHCAMAQFLKDTGRAVEPFIGSSVWCDLSLAPSRNVLPAWANSAASAGCNESAWTFGALVDRLERQAEWIGVDAYMADIEQVVS